MNTRSIGVGAFAIVALVGVGGVRPFARQGAATPAAENVSGVREAAWSPDSKRLAVSRYGAVWTMAADGRDVKKLVSKPGDWIVERDPAWSPDGQSIAFSADTAGQLDIWIAPANGGAPRRLTTEAGDERWPAWTRDGRVVFSHRAPKGAWQLFAIGVDGAGSPAKITPDAAAEWQGRVSADGKRVAFISDREPDAGNDVDLWVRDLPAAGATGSARAIRVTSLASVGDHPRDDVGGKVQRELVRPEIELLVVEGQRVRSAKRQRRRHHRQVDAANASRRIEQYAIEIAERQRLRGVLAGEILQVGVQPVGEPRRLASRAMAPDEAEIMRPEHADERYRRRHRGADDGAGDCNECCDDCR